MLMVPNTNGSSPLVRFEFAIVPPRSFLILVVCKADRAENDTGYLREVYRPLYSRAQGGQRYGKPPDANIRHAFRGRPDCGDDDCSARMPAHQQCRKPRRI